MSSTRTRLLLALLAFAGSTFAADVTAIDSIDRWLLTSGDEAHIKVAAKNLVAEPERSPDTFDLAAQSLDAYLNRSVTLDEDTAAWLIRALGASKSKRYLALVERASTRGGKLERYAANVRDDMRSEGIAWTPDAADPERIRRELHEQKQRHPAPTGAQFANIRVGVMLQVLWPVLGPPDNIAIIAGDTYLHEFKNRIAADLSESVPPLAGGDAKQGVRKAVSEVAQMEFEYRGLGRIALDRYSSGWVVTSVTASSTESATASTSTLLLQQFRGELRSGDPQVVRRAARHMVDSLIDDESVLAEARAVIIDNLAAEDENMVDAMSLLCRALGQSSDAESHRLLERVAKQLGTLQDYIALADNDYAE